MGFEASSYTVREDEGEVEVCVVVQQPVAVDFPFQVLLSAANGIAGVWLHVYVRI